MTNTLNDFLLGSHGATIIPALPMRITTRQQAYRTAAWLTVMAVVLPEEQVASTFDDIIHAIRSS